MEPEENLDFRALENALRKLGPARLPAPLQQRLLAAAHAPTPLADRILATWTGLGAIAACLVAALTVWQLTGASTPPRPTAQEIAHQQQTLMEYQKLIASR